MSSEYVHLSFYCITMLFTGRMHKNSLIVQKYILPLISLSNYNKTKCNNTQFLQIIYWFVYNIIFKTGTLQDILYL